jgi:sugar lactone lactonase YvrE
MADTTTLLAGLSFAEGPRWHDDRLVFSDFYRHEVLSATMTGELTVLATVAGQPSGLGWLPDGRMLVVSMVDRRVLRLEPDWSLVEHADLSSLATWHCNDMVVDRFGRAYVGNFGFDLDGFIRERGVAELLGDSGPGGTVVALVQPDGQVSVAAADMMFPNGTVIVGESTLVVAETIAMRLTAFDIAADGSLSNRRVWADLSAGLIAPDGIALDASGGIWVANALGAQAVRVEEGGAVTDEVATSQPCYAVALGGPDGRTLFCCTAPSSDHDEVGSRRDARIETVTVSIPAASTER